MSTAHALSILIGGVLALSGVVLCTNLAGLRVRLARANALQRGTGRARTPRGVLIRALLLSVVGVALLAHGLTT